LRRGLLQWTLGAFSLGSVVLVMLAYVVMLDEMDEVLDDNLRQVATAVARQAGSGRALEISGERAAPEVHVAPDDGALVTRSWTIDGRLLAGHEDSPAFPAPASVGPGRAIVDTSEWKTFTVEVGSVRAMAAQRTAARREMAVEAASKLFIPLVAFALVTAALLALALRRGLAGLNDATGHIARRSAQTLEPVDTTLMPAELQPLAGAFNALMERLSQAFETQTRFVADAAHELRSPITALRLQFGLLVDAQDGDERREAESDMREALDRMQRLVEQLLDLSRLEPTGRDEDLPTVDLLAVMREVVVENARLAAGRRIDLAVRLSAPVCIRGDRHQLRVLLNNLVRNALHYCPPLSHVILDADEGSDGALLRVTDDGPGIASSERERVFDRFYRGNGAHVRTGDAAGSGLGLAIVQAIAERHGASLSLSDTAEHRSDRTGLTVTVQFRPDARLLS